MSEAIHVICYKSKTLSNGEHPLMIRICKNGKKKYRSLHISIKPDYWNFKENSLKECCPDYERIQLIINEEVGKVQRTALEKRIAGEDYTATTLMEGKKRLFAPKTVGESFLDYIQELIKENRVRYAGMYEVSYSSFLKFNKHLDIPFSDIDSHWLKHYEHWMKSQGYAINTIGTRLRHLRVIFNRALDTKQISAESYPFHTYKVAKMNQQTAKRALSKKDIQKVISCMGKSPMEILAVDLFAFSYFTAGINFVDMAYLRTDNIIDNKLVYYRQKTKKQIIIPLQPKALELIAKYAGESFVFPIFSAFHKTDMQKANRLHKVLAKVNAYLKRIGEELKLPIPLTTYVARHSYATVLKRSGVATSIISESLGHSSERITQVYLDSFGNDQMNEAMKNLL